MAENSIITPYATHNNKKIEALNHLSTNLVYIWELQSIASAIGESIHPKPTQIAAKTNTNLQ